MGGDIPIFWVVISPLSGIFIIDLEDRRMMNEQEKNSRRSDGTRQITMLLQNIEESRKMIPTFFDLQQHPIFGASFAQMKGKQVEEVQQLIAEYIEKRIYLLNKTKGGQLFIRFFESQSALFWEFRALNENDTTAQSEKFQTVGKQVEAELFKLEGILTERMLKQEKGLDKVVESFYNIVYLFFPRYNFLD